MEKQVYEEIVKERALDDVEKEYDYYFKNYSERAADKFKVDFFEQLKSNLPFVWVYPECRYLPTKNHIYRNIIWNNYLIIYKVLKTEVWVVGLFHTAQNPKKLKGYKKVK